MYVRICIETMLPQSRREGADVTSAIAEQFPVSDWLDVANGFKLISDLRRIKPVIQVGMLYGWQTKHDDKIWDVSESIQRWKAVESLEDLERLIAAENAKKEAEWQSIVARVDEYLTNFPRGQEASR